MEWRIGCSGYQYPEWKGIFYPEGLAQRKWFDYYCQHFDAVEMNMTYYRFPRVETLRSWYARSPERFNFAVKAPRHITHFKKFKDAERMLSDFYEAVRAGLRDKLGAVLFQFPSRFHFDASRLSGIVGMLDASLWNVLEFRHQSWWNDEVFEALARARATFCGMSHPDLPEAPVSTSENLYYRFHGVPHLYSSRYDVARLSQFRQEIVNHSGLQRAYVFFNNTADGHAVMNARQLQNLCELVH
ncbi:MAG TPA: DUF72 domain-containing protein [Chryseosolibacter sp.]|jgi:uncharacterized protein YecE (DUF72 family)|nr:DUF72 domain-containing protein [Chryseosolibacter sp.]